MKKIDFVQLLSDTQQHISEKYAAALSDSTKYEQLKSYIEKYIRDNEYEVEDLSFKEVCEKLYREMAEYSILTKYLASDEVEEINVNGWNDIAITYTDGRIVKTKEFFFSPRHAVDVVKRLLHHSGMIIDNATPMSQGHLPGNARITALKEPLVDEDRGISVSIRMLHPSKVTKEQIIMSGTATRQMVDFLCMCLRYGVSFLVAGATSSGKTTFLNALLETVPDNKRIFTIESGSRELSLVKETNGRIVNNVVHTLSRPSDNPAYNIAQDNLVVASLRFNPDIVVVGEIRDEEAYSAVEASLTGHTVVSTVHAFASEAAHTRIALLCQKKFDINFETTLKQTAQAFPIVVFAHKLENNERKILDISECEIDGNGIRSYITLFRYAITKNEVVDGRYSIDGHFEQVNIMSDNLKRKLIQFGVPQEELRKYLGNSEKFKS